MTEKTLTTDNIRPALDALRGELAPWPVVAMKQDRLNATQKSAVNSGITSGLVAQIIANTAAIRALESAITGTGLRPLVVASLPAIGTQGILYIVPVTTYDPETDADVVNYSNEYIWIVAPDAPVTEGYYEQVGQTGIVINNGQLTITVNGTSVGTFTANQSGDTTAAITVPTNADYVDRTTSQTIDGVKTFSDGIVSNVTGNVTGDLTGTASKAIADEDGNSIKTSYGKLAGANVWTNVQDYKFPIRFTNDSYVSGTPSANIFYTTIQWGGYVNNTWTASFTINNAIRTNGYSDTSFRTYSQTSNTLTGFVHETNADASDIAFRPIANGTHKLGASSYQWSAVYADSYYYNGTEFQNKFVTIDTSQTISGLKYFSSNILHKTPQTIDVSTNPAEVITGKGLQFVDNAQYWGDITPQWTTDGTFRIRIAMTNYNTSGTSTGWFCPIVLDLAKDGSKIDVWSTHPNSNLGTSTNKWKTLNGINPGALSLPNIEASINIAGDITDFTGATQVSLSSSSIGWVYIQIPNVQGDYIEVQVGNTTSIRYFVSAGYSDSLDFIEVLVPKPQVITKVRVKATGGAVSKALFYPCLGNA